MSSPRQVIVIVVCKIYGHLQLASKLSQDYKAKESCFCGALSLWAWWEHWHHSIFLPIKILGPGTHRNRNKKDFWKNDSDSCTGRNSSISGRPSTSTPCAWQLEACRTNSWQPLARSLQSLYFEKLQYVALRLFRMLGVTQMWIFECSYWPVTDLIKE